MRRALIGSTGTIGTCLLHQEIFHSLFNSSNIESVGEDEYDLVICVGAPGTKWLANQNPAADLKSINTLEESLKRTKTSRFVLISTVDVYSKPVGVHELTPNASYSTHAYGKNRKSLEDFVNKNFANPCIIRLPAIVGPTIRKNLVYDIAHGRSIDNINYTSTFQYYPLQHLWRDILTCLSLRVPLVNLCSEPITVREIYEIGFEKNLVFQKEPMTSPVVHYDMSSVYAKIFNQSHSPYMYSALTVVDAIRSYRDFVSHRHG